MLPLLQPAYTAFPYHPPEVQPPACVVPCFFSAGAGFQLSTLLSASYRLFIESGKNAHTQDALADAYASTADFFVSLTSILAYRLHTAQHVARAVIERFSIHPCFTAGIQTCLHEAIVNAIIHGNLHIESEFHSQRDFEAYCSQVNTRLTRPAFRLRRVHIAAWCEQTHLTLAVFDQGEGFKVPRQEDQSMPHGRGLMLVRSLANHVWSETEPCGLFMRFNIRKFQ